MQSRTIAFWSLLAVSAAVACSSSDNNSVGGRNQNKADAGLDGSNGSPDAGGSTGGGNGISGGSNGGRGNGGGANGGGGTSAGGANGGGTNGGAANDAGSTGGTGNGPDASIDGSPG